MTAVRPPVYVWRLRAVCTALAAVSAVVESVAGLLRELVCAAGWVVLLVGCFSLVFHPHLSASYLVTPGGGALAVLQGMIRPRRGGGQVVTVARRGDVQGGHPGSQRRAGSTAAGEDRRRHRSR